jgi:hypothetical protein
MQPRDKNVMGFLGFMLLTLFKESVLPRVRMMKLNFSHINTNGFFH